jgi:hypothetical protein
MKQHRRWAVAGAVLAAVLALYVYDGTRDDLLARGVTVAGVDIGGLRASEARVKLEAALGSRVQTPISVAHHDARFRLSPRRLRARLDVDGMVQAALARSREGGFIGRTIRMVGGNEVDAEIPLRAFHSRSALRDAVRRIELGVERRPRDARVEPSGSGIATVRARLGVAVDGRRLAERVAGALTNPGEVRRVPVPAHRVRPRVTTRELARRYPWFLTVDRQSFRMRLYRRLRLVKVFTIAVGQVGFDTPAGLYHIQNKAVNPPWSVPNKPWAGELAGRVIPSGSPDNPIKARWLGIYDGAGIHGTDDPASLGSAASHGCIRMSIPEVKRLYRQIPVRTPIYID